ncbi:uncharacterized protein [Prorops nasuta]|uniref:uncharacterized protein n=1 Tax=Prorops nasuta TaxID=863751 RepID=UPI0034CFBF04
MSDPLFKVAATDLKDLLPDIKKQLMNRDEQTQIKAVEKILAALESTDNKSQKTLAIIQLIESDIISNICDAFQISGDYFKMVALKCLSLVGESRKFYENQTATEAVDAMLKVSHFLVESRREDDSNFPFILLGIWEILQRMIKLFEMDLESVCSPHQLLLFLKNLDPWEKPVSDTLKFMSVRLLNIVLCQGVLDEQEDGLLIIELAQKGIIAMMKIIKESGDDERKAWYVTTISVGTCCFAIRLIAATVNCSQMVSENRTALGETIFSAMIYILIPILKTIQTEDVNFDEMRMNFVMCLEIMFSIPDFNHFELSKCLAVDGYIMYFVYMLSHISSTRQNICKLLSEILTHLALCSLFLETWPGDPRKFAVMIHDGLRSITVNSEDWINETLKLQNSTGIAFMIMVYFHILISNEKLEMSLDAFIEIIINIDDAEPLPSVVLKPLWFLFAFSALAHPNPSQQERYDVAVNKLILALQNSDIVNAYTHHISLIKYCLHSIGLPRDIRFKVINLWLIESNGDIKPLLQLNCNAAIRHSLLDIIQKGYPEEALLLSVKAIKGLISTGNSSSEITENVWSIMPNVLSCTSAKTQHVTAILELANILPIKDLPSHIIARCVNGLLQIMIIEDMDLRLKSLAVKQAYVIFSEAISRKCFKICQKYADNIQVIEELYKDGFFTQKDDQELIAASLDLLTIIIQSFYDFPRELECEACLEIDFTNFWALIMRSRGFLRISPSVMKFLYEVLRQAADEERLVMIKTDDIDEKVKKMISVYESIFLMYYYMMGPDRDIIHKCLSAMLNYACKRIKHAMYRLCSLISNYEYIINVISKSEPSNIFHDYVVTWLKYRTIYCPENIPKKRGIFYTNFYEAIDTIVKYAKHLRENGQLDEANRIMDAAQQCDQSLLETDEESNE